MSNDDKLALHNEIEIMNLVDHPNIVQLTDTFEDDKHLYIVMELLNGGTLLEHVTSKKSFSEDECRDVILPIIDALVYCHKLGIVHRDIKLENLLFSSTGRSTGVIKITDFGLAKFLEDDKFANTLCGTPGYVAPEILQEMPYREPCDFWSVGVVLYILLSGEPPFYHSDDFELFEIIKRCEYKMSKPIWSSISIEAVDLITRLLVADP